MERPRNNFQARFAGLVATLAVLSMIEGCSATEDSDPALAVPSPPPSILLILADTLRADHVGAQTGSSESLTPYLDRLAEDSLIFERCFSQAPWTKPSIASLFTSLYPQSHQVLSQSGALLDRSASTDRSETDALSEEAVTLAELLRAQGYRTAAFVANPWIREETGFSQGFDVFEGHFGKDKTAAEVILDRASEWLNGREAESEQPFFLYLHLMDPHGPYDAGQHDIEIARERTASLTQRILTDKELAVIPKYMQEDVLIDAEQRPQLAEWRLRYAAGVHTLDRKLGGFLESLLASDQHEELAVVFVGDHGEQLFERGGWGHGHGLFDFDVHVPLIIRPPGGKGGGQRRHEIVSVVDILPTLLTLAGASSAEKPAYWAGKNLLGDQNNSESVAFFSAVKWHPGVKGIRTIRYKLVVDSETGSVQLYDLEQDALERNNIRDEKRQIVHELMGRLNEWEESLVQLENVTTSLTSEQANQLRALGYL